MRGFCRTHYLPSLGLTQLILQTSLNPLNLALMRFNIVLRILISLPSSVRYISDFLVINNDPFAVDDLFYSFGNRLV